MSGNGRRIHIGLLMLKGVFIQTARRFNTDNNLVKRLWDEISTHYDHPQRHYHTLAHIQQLLDELAIYKEQVDDWDIMVLAVFYHDIIYNVLRTNNEEKSAALARGRLNELTVPMPRIDQCANHILATKSHPTKTHADTALLVDADLSILGSDWDTYWRYAGLIRKEYDIFPDLIFGAGRKEILTRFLKRDRIYLTPGFLHQYEVSARENLKRELAYWENHSC